MNNNECMPKGNCPVLDIDGFMSNGKQFDVDINLPNDNRDVIYGKIKNSCNDPVKDAVVKLVELVVTKDGRYKRLPVTHTFTNKHGEFVFGPLCPDKNYAIDIWVNNVQSFKYSAICHRKGKCLSGIIPEICTPK